MDIFDVEVYQVRSGVMRDLKVFFGFECVLWGGLWCCELNDICFLYCYMKTFDYCYDVIGFCVVCVLE